MIGNGGHATVLVETLIGQQREIKGYTAPNEEKNIFNLSYLGTDEVLAAYKPKEVELILGLGTVGISTVRKSMFENYIAKGYTFANIIHPTAIVASSVKIGHGVQIMAGVIIQTNASIADNTIVNTGAIVDHDSAIGRHVHLASGVTLSGGVKIGDSCHIGAGTSIIQGITIGEETLIGAGSVVVKSIGERKTAYGVPAKEV